MALLAHSTGRFDHSRLTADDHGCLTDSFEPTLPFACASTCSSYCAPSISFGGVPLVLPRCNNRLWRLIAGEMCMH